MKWLYKIALSLFILAGSFFILVPSIVETSQNVMLPDHVSISKEAKQLHPNLLIVDMHADSLLWNRNLSKSYSRGHLDLPRMRQGNIALQFFTIVSKSPKNLNIHKNESASTDNITLLAISQLWPTKTWFSLFERAQYQIDKLKSYIKPGSFQLIRSQEELQKFYEERRENKNVVGGIIGLEGAHAIEEDLPAQMDVLFQEGVRMMAPTHFFDNKIAGSAHGENKSGLTDLGRAFIRMANEKEIIIDLAHASEPTIREALALSSKPMVVSHTGLRGHCDNPRNLSDDHAQAIVAKGGLIAIGFWPTAVCGSSTESVAEAIAYAIQLLGEDNVAIGSDFDGAVGVPFDASRMIWLVQKLIEQDLSVEAIHKVMGMNQLRFLQSNLPKKVTL